MASRIEAAIDRARAEAANPSVRLLPDGGRRPLRVAIGDPQAPLETFFAILDTHGLLAPDGRLHEDVELTSMGDHFDWGPPEQRGRAGRDGAALVSWLAAHPPDQVILLAGNHDLARVGELVGFDDGAFTNAQELADRIYYGRKHQLEPEFSRRYPHLPTAEVVARDFASFTTHQRELVTGLLHSHRFRVATAAGPHLLLSHAGATVDDLAVAGIQGRSPAPEIAAALNAHLDAAVVEWLRSGPACPFTVRGLHHPGNSYGEGRGIFYHRPSNPDHEKRPDLFEGPPRRRFDPRGLPQGLTQAIGHIGDAKCRELLGGWADDRPAQVGVLRHLVSDGRHVRYASGTPRVPGGDDATVIFLDGTMSQGGAARYELLDTTTGRAFGGRR